MQLFRKATENNADIAELCRGFQMPPVEVFMDYNPLIQRIYNSQYFKTDVQVDNLV